jgi:hypothetical protein
MTNQTNSAVELPRYKSHKVVRAAKIADVVTLEDGSRVLVLELGDRTARQPVTDDYLARNSAQPLIGGYYVQYADGYESWSPAEAFESGYTLDRAGEGNIAGAMIGSTSDVRTVNNVMRHQYRVLSDDEKRHMQRLKDRGLDFLRELHSVSGTLGQFDRGDDARLVSRELSIAATKIEEAVMWAVKHITR